ncbi:MAG: transposase [Clostridia bacterium]|nr:transposase [Clostridia bacterium]
MRAVRNSILAGIVYQHPSIESLRRELKRNGQLRHLCGIDPVRGEEAVPPAWVYSRFLKKLMARQNLLEAMFNRLVEELTKHLPDFGRVLPVGGKAIASFARGRKRQAGKVVKRDGRHDVDADWGQKTLRRQREDGSTWEKVVRWFGYKLHLVVDATYDLPVAFSLTQASASEVKQAHWLRPNGRATTGYHPKMRIPFRGSGL